MKIVFYMTTILEYYWWMEKWIIDTSIWLKNRFPNLDISIITMDNTYTERLNKILARLWWFEYKKENLYKEDLDSIKLKLGNIKYIKISSFKSLKKELSKADIIYSKNEILEAFIFKFIIWYKNIKKIIFWCHTALYYPHWSRLHNFIYTTGIYTFFTSWVSKFHVLNSSDKQVLLNKKRTVVKIFNPINLRLFEKSLKNNIFKIQINKDKFNIVWVWRLTKQKGIYFLLEIIYFINKLKNHNIEIHIAWEWEEKIKINNLTKKYNFVKYYWHIDNNKIPSFLSNMDLYIHTSLWESYWLTLIESNMVNVPVLAFNIPWPKDIIEDGKNWILCNNKEIYFKKLNNFINKKYSLRNSKEKILEKLNDDYIYDDLKNLLIN
jgi:glycosyltransferase involved in cell wall biosynthesis